MVKEDLVKGFTFKVPATLINNFVSQYPSKSGDLIEVVVAKNVDSFGNGSSVAVEIERCRNSHSSYGYFYIKLKNLLEGENMDHNYKYILEVKYYSHDTVKYLGTNTEYQVGDNLVITSRSNEYEVVKISRVIIDGEVGTGLIPLFDRRIITSFVDTFKIKQDELSKVIMRIKEINTYISNKYLLLLLNNETNEELDCLKVELKELITKQTELEKELSGMK